MATRAATELAALDPMPLPNGNFLCSTISTPTLLSSARRNASTATLDVFLELSRGSLPSSPVISLMTTPGVSVNVRITSSAGDSTAKPKTSNPQETFATVAGASALTDFNIGLFGIISDANNVCKYARGRYVGAGTRAPDDHRPLVVSSRSQQNDVVT